MLILDTGIGSKDSPGIFEVVKNNIEGYYFMIKPKTNGTFSLSHASSFRWIQFTSCYCLWI